MNTDQSRKKIPAWILIAGAVFVFVVVAGVLALMSRKIPACARPEAIQKRFAEQIGYLEELAAKYPGDFNFQAQLDSFGKDPIKPAVIADIKDAMWERIQDNTHLFSDPAILEASVISSSDDATVNLVVFKEYEESAWSWSPSVFFGRSVEDGSPSVSIWYGNEKRLIKYERYFDHEPGEKRGCRLVLDLDRLE